jgi:hypothetical protein
VKKHITLSLGPIVALLLVVFLEGTSLALNTPTHQLINEQAAQISQVDRVLKEQLGLPDGIASRFKENRALQWIGLGGRLEDATTWARFITVRSRFYNHFLDPLQPRWDQAGLQLPLLPRFESSVRWAQRTDQDSRAGFGNYSWPDARRYYLAALRGESPGDREQAFADTFRALGQVMHLVVDASVPEHVRADPHPLGVVFGNYEYWVSDQHPDPTSAQRFIADFLSAPITPDPGLSDIPSPVGEDIAKVPIARLFDTDRYTGANPGVTAGSLIGIAEVANANFLSEDTRHGQYPHPARANMELYVRLYTETGLPRRYYKMKLGFGLPVDPVAEECLLNEFTGLDELCVDPGVWRETARKMLPRAVGYSQAVLDYFFRGTLDFTVDSDPQEPTQRRLIIGNATSSEETMDGTFTLYYEDKDGKRYDVPGGSTTQVLPQGYTADLTFTPPTGVQAYVLVFQGTLGAEEGAVAGKVKPLGPFIFVIQEKAEFTGEEARATVVLADYFDYFSASATQSKDPRKQRAMGTFFAPGTPDPGKDLKRVWLEFDGRAFASGSVRLRLNGSDVGGILWDRETSPIQEPRTWEIVFDVPAFYESFFFPPINVPQVPRFLVLETVAGTRLKTPLVWWRDVATSGGFAAGSSFGAACPPEIQCSETLSTGTSRHGLVFFGDGDPEGRDRMPTGQRYPLTAAHTAVGFSPIQGVAGYDVGTLEQRPLVPCEAACTPVPCSANGASIRVFATFGPEGPVWSKDEFLVSLSNEEVVRKPPACVRPAGQTPEAPALPELRFRRDYLPAEQSVFQEFGVVPPDSEITQITLK